MVAFRLHTRIRVVREPGWDDFFVVLAALFNLVSLIAFLGGTAFHHHHHQASSTDSSRRHSIRPGSSSCRRVFTTTRHHDLAIRHKCRIPHDNSPDQNIAPSPVSSNVPRRIPSQSLHHPPLPCYTLGTCLLVHGVGALFPRLWFLGSNEWRCLLRLWLPHRERGEEQRTIVCGYEHAVRHCDLLGSAFGVLQA
jgi:hypothetical protein